MIENNSNYTLEIIDKISKLDCKTIVFSKNSTITDSLNTEKCTIFSPKITNPYHGLLLNSFNPGLINSSHVTTYHAIDKILNEFKDIPKYKKFNFIANDMSPQWVFIYILMKKNGILKDTYYTNPRLWVEGEITEHNHMYNFDESLVNHFGMDILNTISKEEFYKVINNLQHDSLQFKWNDSLKSISPFNFNSYVSIIPPDSGDYNNYPFAADSIFRPFLCKNIPLFIGSYHTQEVVKNYGFDLFEDIFELPDRTCEGLDRVNNMYENIQRINNKTHEELFELYTSLSSRLDKNFKLLRELGNKHISHIINLITEK